jgi:hypothetical protein
MTVGQGDCAAFACGGTAIVCGGARRNQFSRLVSGARRLQVNAALDDIASLCEANAKLMAAARANGRGLPQADRKWAQTLLHSVAVRRQTERQTDSLCLRRQRMRRRTGRRMPWVCRRAA